MFNNVSLEECKIYFDYQKNKKAASGIKFIEQLYIDTYYKTRQVASSPIQVGLNITNRCNLSCRHCSKHNSNSDDMKNWRQIIDKLISLQVIQFYITGGEPLCNPEIISILNYIKNKDKYFKLLTNGTLGLDRILQSVKFSKYDSIQISLDDIDQYYASIILIDVI